MSNLKVLQLSQWMFPRKNKHLEQERQDCLSRYKTYEPVMNRPGRYKLGKKCWFEVDGRAYADDMFNYDLDILNAERYNARQVLALESVVAQKLATREQRKLLDSCHQITWLRRIRLNSYRSYLSLKKTISSSKS